MKVPGWVVKYVPTLAKWLLERRAKKSGGTLRKIGGLVAVVGLLAACAPLVNIVAKDCRLSPCDAGQRCVPDGDGTIHRCIPEVEPSQAPPDPPEPSPTAGPPESPKPSPTAGPPSPKPSPIPTIAPPPPECVAKPQCMTKDGRPATGCVSCAQWIAGQPPGELVPEGDLLVQTGTRGREYLDPKTCHFVYGPGDRRTRNKRPINDGEVCGEPVGCAANPQPCPSPTPVPSPSATPPPPPGGTPPLTESGNLPINYLADLCGSSFSPTHEVGIAVLSQRECSGEPDCRVVNLHATEKSVKPYCEHSCYDESGRYALSNCRNTCETLRECQQPEFVNGNTGIVMEIWGPQVERGACDKRTAPCELPDCRLNFICHDRVVNRPSKTFAQACMPDRSRCGPVKDY